MSTPSIAVRDRGLVARILLAFALIAILPFVIAGALAIQWIRGAAQDEALLQVQDELQAVSRDLSGQLELGAGALRQLAQATALRQLALQLDLPKGPTDAIASRVSEDLSDFMGGHARIVRLRLVSRDGRTLMLADRGVPGTGAPPALGGEEQEALRVALTMGAHRVFVSPMLPAGGKDEGPATLLLAAGVGDQGSARAVLIADLPAEGLTAPLEPAAGLRGAQLHLLDRSGRILRWRAERAAPAPTLVPAIQAGDSLPRTVADQVMSGESGAVRNGAQHVVFTQLRPALSAVSTAAAPLRWSLAASLPEVAVRGPVGALWIWFAVLVSLLAAMSVLGLVLARRLTAPLSDLAAQAREIAGGAHARRIDLHGQEPLGSLASSINTLAEHIEELREAGTKQAHEQARLLEVRTRQLVVEVGEVNALLDHLPDGALLLDGEGRVERCNAKACTVLGIDQVKLHGAWLPGFLPAIEPMLGHDGPDLMCIPQRDSTLELRKVEVRGRDGAPARLVLSLRPLQAGSGTAGEPLQGALGADMLRECAAALHGIFGRSLSGMQAMARALLKEVSMEDAHHKHLARLESEIARLGERLKPLAVIAEGAPASMSAVSVARELAASVALLELRAQAQGVRIETAELASDLPPLQADAAQFRQVLLQLMANSLDAMPEGGTLALAAQPAGERLEITVTDSGEGIAEAQLAKVFEPFVTTRQGRPGLGLSCVRRILKKHGAEISVASAAGRGTRIRLSWPLDRGTPAA